MNIPETLLLNQNISDQTIMVYIGLKLYCSTITGAYYSIKCLSMTLRGDASKDNIRIIRSSIKELEDNKMITLPFYDKDIFSVEFICKDKYFGTITASDYIALIRSNKRNKNALIRFLCLLNKCMSNKEKLENLSQSYFKQKLNKSRSTISDYIKSLEQLNIICVNRPGLKQNNVYLVDKIKQ